MSKALELIQRDPFFDDDFFTDSWSDFDLAIQNVLDKFDTKGLKVEKTNRNQCTDVYRNIRTTNIDQDLYSSQALQVTEKEGNFQCVMDVKDFNPNQLQVKVVDNRVVVEGKYEKKSEDGSSMSSKSFYREFTLPGAANLDFVSTALSKDGVLTIKAPKMDGASPQQALSNTQVQQQSTSSVEQSSTSSKQESSTFSKTVKQSFSSTTQSSFSSTSNTQQSSNMLGFDDDSDMRDRMLFSHDNFNLKLNQ